MAEKKGLTLKEKINLINQKKLQEGNETERLFIRRFSILPTNLPKKDKQVANFTRNLIGKWKQLSPNDRTNLQNAINGSANLKSPEALPSTSTQKIFPLNPPMQTSTPKSAVNDNIFNFPSPVLLNRQNKRPINIEGIHGFAAKKHQAENVIDRKDTDAKAMIFGLVSNLAFVVIRDGSECKTFFKCNIPGCCFKLIDEKSLEDHFVSTHKNEKWSGFCGVCAKMNFYPEKPMISVFDEITHIQTAHVNTIKHEVQLCPSNHPRFTTKDPRNNFNPQSPNLYTIENIYNGIESINLRPWIEDDFCKKSKPAAISMLHENALAAFYKCMQKDCVFFTCDVEVFRTHLTHHKDQSEALLCSYCKFRSNTIDDLTKHLQEEHSYDVFQCCYCFYRCMGECNFMTHAKQYHGDKQAVVVIECFRRSFRDVRDRLMNEARMEENVKKFAPPFICSCKASFYIFGSFEKHIREHNQFTVKQCEKCNEVIQFNDVIEHYEKCMNLSCYQCLSCIYGAQNHFKMYEHLSTIHPTKFPLYCDRMDQNSKYDVSDYKAMTLKIPDHKPKNMITIRNVNDGFVLRNVERAEFTHYNQSK